MPKQLPWPIERWVNESQRTGIDAELGELFRALPEQTGLHPAVLRGVERRLESASARSERRRARYWALAFALMSSVTGAALGEWGGPLLRVVGLERAISEPRSVEPSTRARAPRASAPARADRSVSSGSSSEPPSAEREPARPASTSTPAETARAVTAAAPSVAATPAMALARESELLSRALTELRRDRDAASALRSLDRYQAEFPRGVLALEAATARVDALLLLGQRASALELLTVLPIERSGRKLELLLLRAELFAENSCDRAMADFDQVMADSPSGALAERALYGRAGCHLRLGQAAQGRADLLRYAERFPHGRFAEQVRSRLTESP